MDTFGKPTATTSVDTFFKEVLNARIVDLEKKMCCGFPFEAEIQIYMLDADFLVMDSLFTSGKVEAATLGSNFIVSDIIKSKLLIPVSQAKVNTLYQTQYMAVIVSFTTSSTTQHLKIYNDYSFDVQLTGDFNYTFENN
jgi:hypothetical protein